MRILHVLAERGFSGGEHQLLAVLGHLKRHGHDSALVLNRGACFAEHASALDLEIHVVPMRNDMDLPAVLRLRAFFRRGSPDLIHLACSRSHKLGALAGATLRPRAPLVVTRRMDYPLGGGFYKRWLFGRAVSGVVVISGAVRDEVLKVGVDPARVQLIYDGVDCDALAGAPGARPASRAELGVLDEDRLGLTLASLHHRKGLDVLIRALARLAPPPGGRLVWIIAGEGPMRPDLEEQAATLPEGVELRMPGRVEHPERLLAAADLFCLPSRKEGLGVALLEAMAAGLPIVASEVGGMKEAIVSDRSGIHVRPEDPAQLAEAISALLREPDRACELGRAARERVRGTFSITRMCEQTETYYLEVASRRPNAPGPLDTPPHA